MAAAAAAVGGGGGGTMTWHEELASLVGDTGIRYSAAYGMDAAAGEAEVEEERDDGDLRGRVLGEVEGFYRYDGGAAVVEEEREIGDLRGRVLGDGFYRYDGVAAAAASATVVAEEAVAEESLRDQVKGFLSSTGEMLRELGKGCWDIAQQSLEGAEDTYVVKKIRGPAAAAAERLSFLNEYLPEDRDPTHAWPVVIGVFLLALTVLNVNTRSEASVQPPKKVYISPPSANRIQLPDGRYLAYEEQGIPPERARFSLIAPHSFLSSRLAGIPGVKASLLEEFGVRLITYDLPGFGESDPHPGRNLSSSAFDMLHLADAVGVMDKFWVVGYSSGGMHAWAAVRYIPDRLAGVAMFAPMVNPYDSGMTKEERHKTWEKWTAKRKVMYVLARRFPSLLSFFYRRSFLSGKQGQPERWLSLSVGKKDKSLLEDPIYTEFWEKDVAESVRQGDTRPFVEEAMLQVFNWGFSLSDIQVQKQQDGKGLLSWLKSLYIQVEREWAGFLGPIHIWQGMDDRVVPPSVTEYVRRVVPGATVHRLLGEGHFSYFCFCDECHRQIFSTLFGIPQGPLTLASEADELSPPEPLEPEEYFEETMLYNSTEDSTEEE
uniref:AB hydrolase-1 domain-containing protein n=1 Tax=Ananas comosus var. bracteatus TaxID=296719 RepID=A0A6V7PD84_ANACO|nr:unnamed protein product [Ananas comosus var. bracteatus]